MPICHPRRVPRTTGARRLRAITRRLDAAYGKPPAARRLPPIDELVLTILSQNTSDVNRDRAYADLRRAFPTWTAVARAPARGIARAIRRGGLSATKAPRLRAALRTLEARGMELDAPRALAELPDAELWEVLVGLPGVGPKTAACVLLFSLDRPYLPVDTHVHRAAIRLGLVDERSSAVRAQEELQAAVPPDLVYAFHMGLIRHGRAVCVARRPLCSECVLADLCPRVGVTTSR
ncbi:MAG: endonuclease III [Chloroflexota bacterium]|nr:endonuclease III [Chloroflexota bacterium]